MQSRLAVHWFRRRASGIYPAPAGDMLFVWVVFWDGRTRGKAAERFILHFFDRHGNSVLTIDFFFFIKKYLHY